MTKTPSTEPRAVLSVLVQSLTHERGTFLSFAAFDLLYSQRRQQLPVSSEGRCFFVSKESHLQIRNCLTWLPNFLCSHWALQEFKCVSTIQA